MSRFSLGLNYPIIVIGGGGHAKVIIDTLQYLSYKILGFTDLNSDVNSICHVPYLGSDDFIEKQSPSDVLLVSAIGSIKSSMLRKQIFEKWKKKGFSFASVIHPSAIISQDVVIGEGSQLLMGSVVQVGVKIMDNCILNTRCSIDHDCIINSHSHIAPGVIFSGNIQVGECVHVGTGAVVIQGIQIGSYSTIGAGAVVNKNVGSNKTVYGVPAKEKFKR